MGGCAEEEERTKREKGTSGPVVDGDGEISDFQPVDVETDIFTPYQSINP